MNKKLIFIMFIFILLASILISCSKDEQAEEDKILSPTEEEQFKDLTLSINVAVVYGEYGSYYRGRNYYADKGIKKAQDLFKFKLTERYCNRNDDAIMETLREVSKSNDLVICVGKDISRAVYSDVGYEFPDVEFITIERRGKYYSGENTISVMPLENETTYLAGVIAAKHTKSGKVISMISPTDVSTERSKEGFSRGARRVNPDIHIISMLGSPEDSENSTRSSLLSYFDMGFDVIFLKSNSKRGVVFDLAKKHNIKVITENGDFYKEAPDNIIASISRGYDSLIFETMKLKAKKLINLGETVYVGIRKGFDYIIERENGETTLSKSLIDELNSIKMDLAQGKIHFDEIVGESKNPIE